MSQLNVDTIKKADGTGSLTVPAETGTLVIKNGSNDVTLNDITAGGIYLGGTGSANKLDDYEEGTWSPTLLRADTNPTLTYGGQQGYYIKVGAMVTLFFNCQLGSVSATGAGGVRIGGIPFTTSADDTFRAFGGFGYINAFQKTNIEGIRMHANPNQNYIRVFCQGLDTTAVTVELSANPISNGYLQGSITYKTDS